MILTPIGIDIKRYPAVFRHLKQFKPALEKRWDKGEHWWELRACDYYEEFTKPKIVFPGIAKEPRFVLDRQGTYTINTTYMLAVDDLLLLAVLNSDPMWAYCRERLTVIGDAGKGGRLRFFSQFVQAIPVPLASESDRAAISALAQKCLGARGEGCEEWEREIDERVAGLYGL